MSGPTRKKYLAPEVLEAAAKRVAQIDPRAVLVGGFAMQFLGSDRLTGDLDVIVDVVPDSVPVIKPLSFGGVKSKIDDVPTDFIVRDDELAPLYEEAWRTATAVSGSPLRIARPEHLLAMKMYAGRTKDNGDAATLIAGTLLDRSIAKRVVKRYLGIYAAKDLESLFAESDWLKTRADADDED